MLAGKLGGVRLSSQHDLLPGYAPWMIVSVEDPSCMSEHTLRKLLAKKYWIAQVVLLIRVSVLPSDVPEHTLRKQVRVRFLPLFDLRFSQAVGPL